MLIWDTGIAAGGLSHCSNQYTRVFVEKTENINSFGGGNKIEVISYLVDIHIHYIFCTQIIESGPENIN